MKNILTTGIVLGVTALLSSQVLAARVSLDPIEQTISLGSPAEVSVAISDLGDGLPPSLGAFLIEVTFDNNILNFASVTYGESLGNPNDVFETDVVTTSGPNMVSLDEFSFLSAPELDALQPDSFTLATLTFTSVGVGTSPLGFGSIDLSDAVGLTTADPTLGTANITVVPLPATFVLLASALLGLSLVSRSHRPRR